jgi:predicted transcriptional regulator
VIETRIEFEIVETAIYDGAFRKKALGVLLQKRDGIIVRRVNQVGGKRVGPEAYLSLRYLKKSSW